MKKMILSVIVILCIGIVTASDAHATITVNGFLDDWGVTPGAFGASDWVPDNGAIYTEEDTNINYVGPGYGGQKFDAEAIYCKKENGFINVAIVTGHPAGGASGEHPGDIFFNFGVGMQYGLQTTGVNAGRLYKNPLWNIGSPFAVAGESTMKPGAYEDRGLTDFVYLHTYTGCGDSNDHWVMEMKIPESYFGGDWMYGGFIHWTQTCGNDAIDLEIPGTIPEPATMALFGIGLAGLLRVRRKKRQI